MRLTVLGSSGTFPTFGKPCSGYLVAEGDARLLLDCGTGVLASLQAHVALEDLTAIIISHMHADHFIDLVPMRYALTYGERRRAQPVPIFLPPGGREIWEGMVAAIDETKGTFSSAFDIQEYKEGQDYRIGPLTVNTTLLCHYVPDYGITVRRGGARLVYTGDTGPCPQLQTLAHGVDMLLCEATQLEADPTVPNRGHLTATEVGEVARQAEVRRLLLTHISPDVDSSKSLEAAKAVFSGQVSLAKEGQTYEVSAE